MENIKTLIDVKNKFDKGEYSFNESRPKTKKLKMDYIFDENLSVKENREMVIKHNDKVDEEIKEYNRRYNNKSKEFESDLINAINNETGLNLKKSKKVFSYIYRESHSNGMYDMIVMTDELIELINDIL